MPSRSGAMQRPSGSKCGNTLRQRYDEVGLPCSSRMGLPFPTSTYAISLSRIRCRFFWYGNAEEIMFASPVISNRAKKQLQCSNKAVDQGDSVHGQSNKAQNLTSDCPRPRSDEGAPRLLGTGHQAADRR